MCVHAPTHPRSLSSLVRSLPADTLHMPSICLNAQHGASPTPYLATRCESFRVLTRWGRFYIIMFFYMDLVHKMNHHMAGRVMYYLTFLYPTASQAVCQVYPPEG